MILEVISITKKNNFKVLCKCNNCGVKFIELYSQIKDKQKVFCSRKCYAQWKSKNLNGENNPFYNKKHTDKLKKEFSKNRKGENNYKWKGGRKKDRYNYILIYNPEHPNTTKAGYVLEHRLVMEKIIGRYLRPEEVVHHINEIRDDNRIQNLMLFPNSKEHNGYHKLLKAS